MPQGLMVFNGSGQIISNTNDGFGHFLNFVTVTTANTGNATITTMAGTPFILRMEVQNMYNASFPYASTWIDGNQFRWSWNSNRPEARTSFVCIYGVY